MFPHDIYGFERPLEEAVRENPKWASARIRGLEAENRCLKMCLDNWRKLAEIVDAYFEGGLGPVDAMKQVIRIVNWKDE